MHIRRKLSVNSRRQYEYFVTSDDVVHDFLLFIDSICYEINKTLALFTADI